MRNIKKIAGLIPKGLIVSSLSSRDNGEGPEYHFEKAGTLIIMWNYCRRSYRAEKGHLSEAERPGGTL